jgi:hypothetical protein
MVGTARPTFFGSARPSSPILVGTARPTSPVFIQTEQPQSRHVSTEVREYYEPRISAPAGVCVCLHVCVSVRTSLNFKGESVVCLEHAGPHVSLCLFVCFLRTCLWMQTAHKHDKYSKGFSNAADFRNSHCVILLLSRYGHTVETPVIQVAWLR